MLANQQQQQQFFCSATTLSSNNSCNSSSISPTATATHMNHLHSHANNNNNIGCGPGFSGGVSDFAGSPRNSSLFAAAYHQYHHHQNYLSTAFHHQQQHQLFRHHHPQIGLITPATGTPPTMSNGNGGPPTQPPTNPQLETIQTIIGIPQHPSSSSPASALHQQTSADRMKTMTSSMGVPSNAQQPLQSPSPLFRNYVNVIVYQQQQQQQHTMGSNMVPVTHPAHHQHILPMIVQQQIC